MAEKGESGTKDLRDSHKQQQKRKNSTSEHKESKEAAHTVSLEIADHVTTKWRDPGKTPEDEREILKKEFVNEPGNMRMVYKETNDRHRIIDKSIMEKLTQVNH